MLKDYFVSMEVLQKIDIIKKLSMLFYIYESHEQDVLLDLKIEDDKQSIVVTSLTRDILEESKLTDKFPIDIKLSIKFMDGIIYMEVEE